MSADGTIGYAQVSYDEPAIDLGVEPFEALQSVLEDGRSPDLEMEIGGEYASWGTQPETGTSELIGLLAAMIILLIAFGSVVAMGLPIGTAVIGLATGTGLTMILAAFASVPEFATILSSMIGLGVGIDYALFIVTRYRQNLHDGMTPLHAVGLATATAGQAVVFSGIIVAIALLGLWISGIAFVGMMATAAAIVVLVAVVAAVTLLPAFLGFAGNAIDKLSVHRRRKPTETSTGNVGMWTRWGHEVERHPWRYFVGAALVLVVLAIPLFSMQLGFPDDGTAPTSETRRRAYDLLSEGFGPGFNGPLLLAVEIDDPAALQELEVLTSAIDDDRGRGGRHAAPAERDGRCRDRPGHPHHLAAGSSDDRAGAATPGRHDPRSHAARVRWSTSAEGRRRSSTCPIASGTLCPGSSARSSCCRSCC